MLVIPADAGIQFDVAHGQRSCIGIRMDPGSGMARPVLSLTKGRDDEQPVAGLIIPQNRAEFRPDGPSPLPVGRA
jgi:hypothetical protein